MYEFDLSNPDERNEAAAQYVLGTLSREDKAHFESLLAVSHDAQQEVQQWREHLDILNRSLEPIEPPATAWRKISKATANSGKKSIWSWQPLVGFSLAVMLAVGLIFQTGVLSTGERHQDMYVYVINNEQQQPGWMINTSMKNQEVVFQNLREVKMPDNRVYEAWLMADGIEPIRLGFLPDEGETRIKLKKEWMPNLKDCKVVITMEGPEGAPSGYQMGPVSDKAEWKRLQF